MKLAKFKCIAAITLFAALVIPAGLAAQEHKSKHQKYKLIDLGTFGGPVSYIANDPSGGGGASGSLSPSGSVVGAADTSIPDPNYPNTCLVCPLDPLILHAFRWQDDVLTDLGALPGVNSSFANWISPKGLVAGFSENSAIDPLLGVPEVDAVLWKDGEVFNLGTLEGGYESNAFAVNDRGQVAGVFLNTIPDPFSPFGLQVRSFLWQNGVMKDLGTLGTGTTASAWFMNESGQIAGSSYTNTTPNPVTGVPTFDPFLWETDSMIDLGTLGGTFGFPNDLNNLGEVVGQSNLAGDLSAHPFLWDKKTKKMQDLGTLGGSNGEATWINDEGEVVGSADLPGSGHHAFLWKPGMKKLQDLGTVDGDACSHALNINSQEQVVGNTSDCVTYHYAFLWEKGQMVDLNKLVQHQSGLQLADALNINERGEIAGLGLPPGCGDPFVCGHAFLLTPCDGNHDDGGDCEDNAEGATAPAQSSSELVTQNPRTIAEVSSSTNDRTGAVRGGFGHRYPNHGFGTHQPN